MSSGGLYSTVDCDSLDTLDYDKASGAFYGIGLLTSPQVQRVLVRLSPDAKACNVVGAIPDHFMIAGGVSALDEGAGILCECDSSANCLARSERLRLFPSADWISAPGGYPVNYTLNVYNLIGTRLSDASTVSDVPFCCFGGCQPPATQPICPWSLEFNNGT